MKKNNIQSRREFFKDAAKSVLPVLGAVVLGGVPHLLKAEKAPTNCYSCSGSCLSSCTGTCYEYCRGGCKGSCAYTCLGNCSSCTGCCSGSCYGLSF